MRTGIIGGLIIAAALGCDGGQYTNYSRGGSGAANYPVTVPAGATAFTSLEKNSGWVGDSTFGVSGAFAPAICSITPPGGAGAGNPCPGAGGSTGGTYTGAGGGSSMVLGSTGPGATCSGVPCYSGWMARYVITTGCSQHNMLLDFTIYFDAVTPIQAFEVGRRYTNCSQVTDNGQMQFVPIGGGLLELDYVPNGGGSAWTDTGCRFSMFAAGNLYTGQIYYVNDANGAMSEKYVSLNGTRCVLPASTQHQAGAVQSPAWTANSAVMAFQPDIKPGTAGYNTTVTMSAWTW